MALSLTVLFEKFPSVGISSIDAPEFFFISMDLPLLKLAGKLAVKSLALF